MEPTPPPSRPSFALLGADAFLAARPATPVQLAHACTRGGYDAAIPASWGDELIAERCIERLSERTLGPAVFCSCSYVRDRLLASGPDLAPFMLSFVAPPVAAARYLRQLYAGRPIDITYVGACPSADDEAIDRQVAPKAFFAELRAQGIILSQQPTVFNSMFAPDRRRCLSQPGGLPTPQLLERQEMPRELVEIGDFEYAAELAQRLIMSEPVLIDLATRSGCACSGAAVGVPPTDARGALVALEPPRSAQPIVEHDLEVPVDLPIPVPSADRGPPPPRDDSPGRAPDRPERPVVDTSDFPDWPTDIVAHYTRPSAAPAAPPISADVRASSPDIEVDLEFRAAPVSEVPRSARPEPRSGPGLEPRLEPRREPRLEIGGNFELQFDRAFREAFTSVPLALPIPRQPATEEFDFPLFDREVPLLATLDSPTEAARRRTQVPRARSAAGRSLPRAYVAHRAGTPPSGELVVRAAPRAPSQAPAEPTTAEPARAEPTIAEPARAEPTIAESARAEPTIAESARSEPTTAESARAEPATASAMVPSAPAPVAVTPPLPTTELAPIPPTARVSVPSIRSARSTPPEHMPLFAAFAASGVLSAATEGDTGPTREALATAVRPPVVSVPDRPVPLQRTVETPTPRPRRKPPAIRTRVVRQPRGLSLIGHWLRQIRLRHLALIIIGLLTLALGVAFALGYLPNPGVATGPEPFHSSGPAPSSS